MNLKLFLYSSLLLLFACRESEIKSQQVERCFENFPKDKDTKEYLSSTLRLYTQAKEAYIIHTGDNWTYSTTIIFEKYNDWDYRLRTKYHNHDSIVTGSQISKQDWDYVCSSMDSLNFWCTNPKWESTEIDGHETTIIGKIDSHFHRIRVDNYRFNYENRHLGDSQNIVIKKKVIKAALRLLKFGGYEGFRKPRFIIESDRGDTIKLLSWFNDPFIKSSEFYINQKKIVIDKNEGYFEIKIPKSDFEKAHLIAKAVLLNGETCTYEVELMTSF